MRPRFCKQAKSSHIVHFTHKEKDEGETDFKSSKEERTAKEIAPECWDKSQSGGIS